MESTNQMRWNYRTHQIEGAKWCLNTLRTRGLAYLHWEERTNKTGAALLAAEMSKAETVLVVTKKKALEGWQEHLDNLPISKEYTLINYESLHKIKGDFDLIIIDESHYAISSIGRPSKTWKLLIKFTVKKPIIYLSATGYSEHMGLLYHQLKLSSWSPFKEISFYAWFKIFGVSKLTRTPYGLKETYSKYRDKELLAIIKPYFSYKTRAEVGIEHEPSVNLVKVPMSDITTALLKKLLRDELLEIEGEVITLDTPMKTRTIHYQVEGGTIKGAKKSYIINSGKLDYIRKNYDLNNIAIMAHFVAERQYLEQRLPEVPILSSDGHAEGVDLSHIDKLLVYSMSFKTSKHSQRICRQANHSRTTPIVVDILVSSKPFIGEEIYNTVAKKKIVFDKHSYDIIMRKAE